MDQDGSYSRWFIFWVGSVSFPSLYRGHGAILVLFFLVSFSRHGYKPPLKVDFLCITMAMPFHFLCKLNVGNSCCCSIRQLINPAIYYGRRLEICDDTATARPRKKRSFRLKPGLYSSVKCCTPKQRALSVTRRPPPYSPGASDIL